MSYTSKFVAAVVGLMVMAVFASRHLFLFTVFRDPPGSLDSQAGRYHLWLAISAGIAACIAAALMFYFFLRHDRNTWTKVRPIPIGLPLADVSNDLFTNSPTQAPFDPTRWALANPWLAEGQADDRTPMNGSVAESGGSASAQRAFARRFHQIMFKKMVTSSARLTYQDCNHRETDDRTARSSHL